MTYRPVADVENGMTVRFLFPLGFYMMKRHWAPIIKVMSRYAIFATGLENLVH